MPLTRDEADLRREIERETRASRNRWQREHPRKRGQKVTGQRDYGKIPTPRELRAQVGVRLQNEVNALVVRINKYLYEHYKYEGAVTIQLDRDDQRVLAVVTNLFQAKGWQITYEFDQRDGDFIRIEPVEDPV